MQYLCRKPCFSSYLAGIVGVCGAVFVLGMRAAAFAQDTFHATPAATISIAASACKPKTVRKLAQGVRKRRITLLESRDKLRQILRQARDSHTGQALRQAAVKATAQARTQQRSINLLIGCGAKISKNANPFALNVLKVTAADVCPDFNGDRVVDVKDLRAFVAKFTRGRAKQGGARSRPAAFFRYLGLYLANLEAVGTCDFNRALVAAAGPDQWLLDDDDDGVELVRLDGSASSGPVGAPLSYSWAIGGTVVASGSQAEIELPLGSHIVELTVGDARGLKASDQLTVSVGALPLSPCEQRHQTDLSVGRFSEQFLDQECVESFSELVFEQGRLHPTVISSGDSLEEGLIALWRLEEEGGLSAEDSAGGNHAQVMRAVQGAPGIHGKSYEFIRSADGGSVLAVPGGNAISIGQGATLSLWFKRNSDPLVGHNRILSSSSFWLQLLSDNRQLNFKLTDTQGRSLELKPILTEFEADVWHHVAVTYDASAKRASLYLNGVRRASVVNSQIGGIAGGQELFIGSTDETGYRSFQGNLDEVAIWQRALSDPEIVNLADSSRPPIAPAQVRGSLISQMIRLPVRMNRVTANWIEATANATRVEISADGINWCALSNSIQADPYMCAALPTKRFYYRLTFLAPTVVESLSFQFARVQQPEHCTNGIDDDLDGLTDCQDQDCAGYALCLNRPTLSCHAQGGRICGQGYVCSMGPVPAADSRACCLQACSPAGMPLSIAATKTEGRVPLPVFFDIIGEGSAGQLGWNEIVNHSFEWYFGFGAEEHHSSLGAYAPGYMTQHVFENPGTYQVEVVAKRGGEIVGRDTVTIKALPRVGRTVCLSAGGNFGLCPSTNAQDYFQDWDAAFAVLHHGDRILLRRGDRWIRTQPASFPNGALVGSFGLPSDPPPSVYFDGVSAFNIPGEGVLQDIHLSGYYPSTPHDYIETFVNLMGRHALLLRADVGPYVGYHRNSLQAQGVAFVVDSYVHDSAEANNESYGFYGGGEKKVIWNTRIERTQRASYRTFGGTALIGYSRFGGAKTNPPLRFYPHKWGYVVGNYAETPIGGAFSAGSNYNGGAPASNVIIERNHARNLGAGGAGAAVWVTGKNIVVRNNTALNYPIGVDIGERWATELENILVYNNTFFAWQITSMFNLRNGSLDPGDNPPDSSLARVKNIQLFNNLAYAARHFSRDSLGRILSTSAVTPEILEDHNWIQRPSTPVNDPVYSVGAAKYNLQEWRTAFGLGLNNRVGFDPQAVWRNVPFFVQELPNGRPDLGDLRPHTSSRLYLDVADEYQRWEADYASRYKLGDVITYDLTPNFPSAIVAHNDGDIGGYGFFIDIAPPLPLTPLAGNEIYNWGNSGNLTMDLNLKAGSPAINQGMWLPGVPDDFGGSPRPQSGGMDLGAFQFNP